MYIYIYIYIYIYHRTIQNMQTVLQGFVLYYVLNKLDPFFEQTLIYQTDYTIRQTWKTCVRVCSIIQVKSL